jgi:hypothetical protein
VNQIQLAKDKMQWQVFLKMELHHRIPMKTSKVPLSSEIISSRKKLTYEISTLIFIPMGCILLRGVHVNDVDNICLPASHVGTANETIATYPTDPLT